MMKLMKFSNSHFITPKFLRFNYMTSVYESPDLRKICQMTNQTFHKYNEDIEHLDQIKLLDQNGKLIGNYTMKQAKKKAEKMKCDIVLVNEAVTPPICKAYNYKEHLYKQFIKEIGHMSSQRKSKGASSSKTITVGTRITEFDMKNKIRVAVDASKKTAIIRVVVKLTPGIDEDDATNTLYAFRDLSAENLVTVGDVTRGVSADRRENEEGEMVEIGNKETEFLQLEFKNARAKNEDDVMGKLSEKEIKRLVQSYFTKIKDPERENAIRPSKEAENMLPDELKKMQKATETKEEEMTSSDEEEKQTVKEKVKGPKKFTELEIKKMELSMKISSLKTKKELLEQDQEELNKMEKEHAEMEEKGDRIEFNEENVAKMMKEANHTLKVLETQTRMTKRLLHLAKLYRK